MLKLIKWSLIGVAGLGATTYFLFGDHAGSYISTMANSVRDGVRGQIPVEFELKRAERLIAEIDPQINTCRRDVARAEVELEELSQQIEDLEHTTARDERKLKTGREVLSSNQGEVVYQFAGQSYHRSRIEADLARTLEVHRNNVTILSSKRALRDRQTAAVEAARQRLDAVRTQKARLEDQIAALKIQKRQLDAMVATSRKFDLDDTALSKAKEVLARVKSELDITQRMIEDDTFHAEGYTYTAAVTPDVGKEIDEFFAQSTTKCDGNADAPCEDANRGLVKVK
jgi:hypothetical protein